MSGIVALSAAEWVLLVLTPANFQN